MSPPLAFPGLVFLPIQENFVNRKEMQSGSSSSGGFVLPWLVVFVVVFFLFCCLHFKQACVWAAETAFTRSLENGLSSAENMSCFILQKHIADPLTSSSRYCILCIQFPAWKVVFRQTIPWGSLTPFIHLSFPLGFWPQKEQNKLN